MSKGSEEFDENVICFCVKNNEWIHANNRKKDTLIVRKDQTDELFGTTITGETEYLIDFAKSRKRITFIKKIYIKMQATDFCVMMV